VIEEGIDETKDDEKECLEKDLSILKEHSEKDHHIQEKSLKKKNHTAKTKNLG